jgi:hypothetical protein
MKMQSRQVTLSIVLFLLAGVPVRSDALTVVISASKPGATDASTTTLPTLINTPPGTSTAISLSGFTINGFTFSATAGSTTLPQVISDVSGGVERVYMTTGTTITAPTAAGSCSATAPCKLTLSASSNTGDFAKKAAGGYPSGVSVSAFLVQADGRSNAVNNTVTVSGQAKALSATAFDAINTTPGAGTGDTPTSLPRACTGKATCTFTAALTNAGSFKDTISETIQLQCATPPCDPAKTFSVTVTFVRPGDKVTFGVGIAQSTTHQVTNSFIGALLPAFSNFSPKVEITKGNEFELNAPFTLNAGSNGISPATEFVNFSLTPKSGTPYSGTIPPGSFKKQKAGGYAFNGVINGAKLEAKITPLGGSKYEFRVEGGGTGLLSGAQNPVCIALTIEDDTSGSTCVSAEIK